MSGDVDFAEMKRWFEEYKKKQGETCPNCGYCPHCGRGRQDVVPSYPIYPYYPQPWWPHGPFYVTSGTITVSGNAPVTTGSAAIGWVDA